MGEKKLREILTLKELNEEIINWSLCTVRRKIENDGFPAIRDGNRFVFQRTKVLLWFKQREVQPNV